MPKTETEVMHNKNNVALHEAGWTYLGCDYWTDPVANVKLLTHTAIQVQKSRDKFKKKMAKQKLLLCSDWEGIRKELQRQLKPFGLTLKTKGNYKKWGDQLLWTVERIPNPEYEKHLKWCDKHGIDPWNNFT